MNTQHSIRAAGISFEGTILGTFVRQTSFKIQFIFDFRYILSGFIHAHTQDNELMTHTNTHSRETANWSSTLAIRSDTIFSSITHTNNDTFLFHSYRSFSSFFRTNRQWNDESHETLTTTNKRTRLHNLPKQPPDFRQSEESAMQANWPLKRQDRFRHVWQMKNTPEGRRTNPLVHFAARFAIASFYR